MFIELIHFFTEIYTHYYNKYNVQYKQVSVLPYLVQGWRVSTGKLLENKLSMYC